MKRAACCWPRKRQPSTSTVDQIAHFSVDVDHTALFYWSTLTTAPFYWSMSTEKSAAVNVHDIFHDLVYNRSKKCNWRRPVLFFLVDNDHPALFYLVDGRCWSTPILQRFSSRPKIFVTETKTCKDLCVTIKFVLIKLDGKYFYLGSKQKRNIFVVLTFDPSFLTLIIF